MTASSFTSFPFSKGKGFSWEKLLFYKLTGSCCFKCVVRVSQGQEPRPSSLHLSKLPMSSTEGEGQGRGCLDNSSLARYKEG